MAGLTIDEPLATRIREAARQEKFSPQEIISILFERHYPAPRPAESLTDEDIDLPDNIAAGADAYREAVRQVRPKLYRIARRYWTKTGDREKLALTDEELDKVFWLIDHEGVPRFKSEKGTIELPHDPMEDLFGLFSESGITDASETNR